jgi:hypothetical protein
MGTITTAMGMKTMSILRKYELVEDGIRFTFRKDFLFHD